MSGSLGVVEDLDASTGAGGSHGGPVGSQETLSTLFFVIGVLENIERERIRFVQKIQMWFINRSLWKHQTIKRSRDGDLVIIIRAAQITDHYEYSYS